MPWNTSENSEEQNEENKPLKRFDRPFSVFKKHKR
jgi:hypothetical protein